MGSTTVPIGIIGWINFLCCVINGEGLNRGFGTAGLPAPPSLPLFRFPSALPALAQQRERGDRVSDKLAAVVKFNGMKYGVEREHTIGSPEEDKYVYMNRKYERERERAIAAISSRVPVTFSNW